MSRWFKLDPTGVQLAAGALYVAAAMLYRAFVDHSGVFQPDLVVAAIMALYGLWTHKQVTPLARPRNKAKQALIPVQPPTPTMPVQPPPAPPAT